MSALLYLAPEFIEEGRLGWLRSPLYIVKHNKKESYYYTDEEYNKARPKGEVTRAKGLGALSEVQAKNSMFGTNQRIDFFKGTTDSFLLLKELMGEEVVYRKNFIFKNVDFKEIKE